MDGAPVSKIIASSTTINRIVHTPTTVQGFIIETINKPDRHSVLDVHASRCNLQWIISPLLLDVFLR